MCFKMNCVTSGGSWDLCGVEKLFCSSWKEIAGQALCSPCALSWQNTSTYRSGRSLKRTVWWEMDITRQPEPVCNWLVSAGGVWARSLEKSLQGSCGTGRVCSHQTRRGDSSISVSSVQCMLWRGLFQILRLLIGTKFCSTCVDSYCLVDFWCLSNRQKS